MIIRTFTYVILFFGCIHSLNAQQNCSLTLAGQVMDLHDRSLLAYAEIELLEKDKIFVANENGKFTIGSLCPKTYSIVIRHIGCEPDTIKIQPASNMPFQTFYLEHHTDLLNEITLTAEKTLNRTSASQSVSLTDVKSKGTSLAEGLEKLAGVTTLATGDNLDKVMIHGLYGSRIATINGGVQHEDQQWNAHHAPTITTFDAGEVEVLKGASSVTNAFGATGGVVLLKGANLNYGNDYSGQAFLNTQSQGNGVQLGLGYGMGISQNWGFRLSLFGEKFGDRSAPNYILSNTGNETVQFKTALGHKNKKFENRFDYSYFLTNIGILRASHIGNLTDLNAAIEADEPWYIEPFTYDINAPRQEVSHQVFSTQNSWQINNQSQISVAGGYQYNHRKEFDVRRGDDGQPAVNMTLGTINAKLDYDYEKTRFWESHVGYNLFIQENSNIFNTGVRPILPNYNIFQSGVYVLQKFKPFPWFYEFAFRYDFQESHAYYFDRENILQKPQFTFNNFAAHLGAKYFFTPKKFWSSQIALVSRAPAINELLSDGLHHSSATLEIGNPDMVSEQSINWNNHFESKSAKWNWQADIYFNYFKDFIYRQPGSEPILTVRGAFPVFYYQQTDALLTGVDFQSSYDLKPNMSYQTQLAVLYAQNISESKPLILMPPWELGHQLQFSILNLGNFFKKLQFELGHEVVLKQFRYPENEDLAPPPPSYQLIDFSISQNPAKANKKFEWQFSIHNLFNTRYRSYLNQNRYYADNQGINFSLKFNYKFNSNEN